MKSKTPAVVLVLGLLALAGSLFAARWLSAEALEIEQSVAEVDAFFTRHVPQPFVNSAENARPPQEAPQPSTALAQYTAPEGFTFYSQSEAWDEAMLEQLYQELLRNRHGDEIYTLRQVTVYAETNDAALATHTADSEPVLLALNFGALPPGFSIQYSRGVSDIVLYGGDEFTTIESMANSLSHEYGHLYTFYYFFNDVETLADSDYARLRDSAANGLITTFDGPDYAEKHHLYLIEVAADDYVQLMGSPTTRQVADYPDVRQQLAGASFPSSVEQKASTNAWPQENMLLPLAGEVPGLDEYYYGFLNEAPPQPAEAKQAVTIGISSGSAGFDLVGGYRTFVYYTLGWNTPYTGAVYTLVCFDDDGDSPYGYPVKTVLPGEAATATIGTVAYESGGFVNWQFDGLDEGTKTFYVIALLPDGTYYRSEPLVHAFG